MTKGEKLEFATFNRPFFADARRMDIANYLAPSWSVGGISVGNYRNDTPKLTVSEPNLPMPLYYLPVTLKDLPASNAWQDGRHRRNPARPTGAITSFDLRSRWETELNFCFHTISFYIPQTAFDQLTDELCLPRVESLSCQPGSVHLDPIAYHLSRTLESIIDSYQAVPSLLAGQILSAVRLHIAICHGRLRLREESAGRLTSDQIRNLKSMMLDEAGRNIRLAELAAACDLPLHVFERAFRRHFGKPPHQWRLAAKIEHARKLLESTDTPLAEIALTCGFSDQAHLTRVFSRAQGLAPGAYRRSRRD